MIVTVKFDNYYKKYNFNTMIPLQVGNKYWIFAGDFQYSSPVTVVGVQKCIPCSSNYKTITKVISAGAPPREKGKIHKVIFRDDLGKTIVLWDDKTKTILNCHEDDKFDREKALALAYMKRWCFDNRSCFNEELKKWCCDEYEGV